MLMPPKALPYPRRPHLSLRRWQLAPLLRRMPTKRPAGSTRRGWAFGQGIARLRNVQTQPKGFQPSILFVFNVSGRYVAFLRIHALCQARHACKDRRKRQRGNSSPPDVPEVRQIHQHATTSRTHHHHLNLHQRRERPNLHRRVPNRYCL